MVTLKISNPTSSHNNQNIQVSATKVDKFKNVPKPYMDFVEGMERQFTNHLLNEMRKTVHTADPETQAEKYYKSIMDDERAKIMAESDSGLGIKEIILDQIYPQYKTRKDEVINAYNTNNLNPTRSEQ